MRELLFFVLHPYFPDALGGSELSFHCLFRELSARGWRVEVVCARPPDRAAPRPAGSGDGSPEGGLGYDCHRVPAGQVSAALVARIEARPPDLVMAGPNHPVLPMLETIARAGIPAFFYSRMLEVWTDGTPPDTVSIIANSRVNAEHLARHHRGPIGLVPPTIDPAWYTVDQRARRFVTFVNPIPVKGLDVAVRVARRLPAVRFLFVKSRWASLRHDPDLAAARALPNVEIREPQRDMRPVYAETDILLFPSQWEETAGRVVIEAQMNGIPVVASPVGGVPAQVGRGGLLVTDKADAAQYAGAIERLRDDPNLYATLSARAMENAARPEFDLATNVDAFVRFVEDRLDEAYDRALSADEVKALARGQRP